MLIHTERIFADHYQFYIFDSNYAHLNDNSLNWESTDKLEYNYIANDKAIYVSTVADLNDHRLRIYENEKPETGKYERIFEHQLNVDSGKLVISTPINTQDDDIVINLKKKQYTIFVCSNSIGKDFFSFDQACL